MKKNISLFIKGFIMGIANIIPGVSGGTLAITLGIYEDLIGILSNFLKNIKKNIKFLLPIGIGMIASILSLSKVINYCLEHFEIQTILFFIGLILGGLPLILKKAKLKKIKLSNIIVFLITFSVIMSFTFIKGDSFTVNLQSLNIIKEVILFLVGMVAAATMVIPGISGSFVLMLLGYYKPIIDTISNLTNYKEIFHNSLILFPFGIGVIIGIVLVAKLIEFLLNKYEHITYSGILGFIIASIFSILLNISAFNMFSCGIGLIFMAIGFIIAYKISYLK